MGNSNSFESSVESTGGNTSSGSDNFDRQQIYSELPSLNSSDGSGASSLPSGGASDVSGNPTDTSQQEALDSGLNQTQELYTGAGDTSTSAGTGEVDSEQAALDAALTADIYGSDLHSAIGSSKAGSDAVVAASGPSGSKAGGDVTSAGSSSSAELVTASGADGAPTGVPGTSGSYGGELAGTGPPPGSGDFSGVGPSTTGEPVVASGHDADVPGSSGAHGGELAGIGPPPGSGEFSGVGPPSTGDLVVASGHDADVPGSSGAHGGELALSGSSDSAALVSAADVGGTGGAYEGADALVGSSPPPTYDQAIASQTGGAPMLAGVENASAEHAESAAVSARAGADGYRATTMEDVNSLPIAELQSIVSQNTAAQIGEIAANGHNIPKVGFHGLSQGHADQLFNTQTSVTGLQTNFGATGAIAEDPAVRHSDMIHAAKQAIPYSRPGDYEPGPLVVANLDARPTKGGALTGDVDDRAGIPREQLPGIGQPENAVEYRMPLVPENFAETIAGTIAQETLSMFQHIDASSPEAYDRSQLGRSLALQAVIEKTLAMFRTNDANE